MPNRPIRPTSDDTFQVSPAISSARMPPTNAIGTVPRIMRGLDGRTERDEQQDEHAKERRPDRQRQRARRARLALDPAAEVEEVAGRQLQLLGQDASDLRCGAAEIAPADRRLDRDAAGARLAPNRGGAERLRHVRELAERNLACRRGRRSAACESRRACRGDRPAAAPRDRSGADRSRSATPLRRPGRSAPRESRRPAPARRARSPPDRPRSAAAAGP